MSEINGSFSQNYPFYAQIVQPQRGSGDKSLIFNQNTALEIWVIPHGLNKQPSITILDEAGNTIIGDIEYTDLNSLKITFSEPVIGVAYLN